MTRLLNVAALLVLAIAGVLFLWPSRESPQPPVAVVDPAATDGSTRPEANPASTPQPAAVASAPATLPAAPVHAALASQNPYSPSPADSGLATVAPPPQTFVGPDGEEHLIPAASPELLALADPGLRLAVLDEIRSDPEAFALAMGVELSHVQRVADGRAELPADWVVQ